MSTLPLADATAPGAERRRSQRVLLVIPLEVAWISSSGVRVLEHAETEVVNAHSALMRMKARLPRGTQVELNRLKMHEKSQGRVVFTGQQGPDGLWRIGVELALASAKFWGVTLPPEGGAKK